MSEFQMVTTQKMTIANHEFKNPALAQATQEIVDIYEGAVAYASEKNKMVAAILGRVATERSYVEDGFTSVADYAGKIFNIKRQNAYNYAAAGKLYNDDSINVAIQDFSHSKAAELAGVDRDTLNADLMSGKIKPDMTQKQLRSYAETAKQRERDADELAIEEEAKEEETEIKVLDMYTAEMCLNYRPIDEVVNDCSMPRIMDDWHNYFESYVENVSGSDWPIERVKLPKGKATKDAKKPTVERFLYMNHRYSLVVEYRKYVEKVQVQPKQVNELTADELIGRLSREQLMALIDKLNEDYEDYEDDETAD